MPRDFTKDSLGVRVYDDYCVVIVKKPGVNGWQEDGQRLPLPLVEGFDSVATIPASRIGIAVRACEVDDLSHELRALLTRKPNISTGD